MLKFFILMQLAFINFIKPKKIINYLKILYFLFDLSKLSVIFTL